jgi:hypothetical protein
VFHLQNCKGFFCFVLFFVLNEKRTNWAHLGFTERLSDMVIKSSEPGLITHHFSAPPCALRMLRDEAGLQQAELCLVCGKCSKQVVPATAE